MTRSGLWEEDEDLIKYQYLTFSVGEETYGIGVEHVREIMVLPAFIEIPDMPRYVKGIINLRGAIIPIMDLKSRFNDAFESYHARTCVVIVEFKGVGIGLVVDALSEVVVIREKDCIEHPIVGMDEGNAYIETVGSIDDSVVYLLNTEKLLAPQLCHAIEEWIKTV